MKKMICLSACLVSVTSLAMQLEKIVQKLTPEERREFMQQLQAQEIADKCSEEADAAQQHSQEDSAESSERSLSSSSSSMSRRSPRADNASPLQIKRSLLSSIGKKAGSTHTPEERAQKKSPRTPRIKPGKEDLIELKKKFAELLEIVTNKDEKLSKGQVQQLIKKASSLDLLRILCSWTRANPHLIPLIGYPELIKALFESTGYVHESKEKGYLDTALFSEILELFETYAAQQLVIARHHCPENDAARELSICLDPAIKLYATDLEVMLCRRLRLAIRQVESQHFALLCTDLEALIKNAHGSGSTRTNKMLKGELLRKLRALITKQRGMPAYDVILPAFTMLYGAKIEDSLYKSLFIIAQSADAAARNKKKAPYKNMLEEWAKKVGNERYMTTSTRSAIIKGTLTESDAADDVIELLDKYELDRTVELPVIGSSTVSASLVASRAVNSSGEDESTFSSNIRMLAEMKTKLRDQAKAHLLSSYQGDGGKEADEYFEEIEDVPNTQTSEADESAQLSEDKRTALAQTAPPRVKPLPVRPVKGGRTASSASAKNPVGNRVEN